jgi:hypothetical protein
MLNKYVFFVALLTMVMISCIENNPNNTANNNTNSLFDRETFDRKHQLWLEQDINNYSIVQTVGGGSSGPLIAIVYVRNGILSFLYDGTAGPGRSPFLPNYPWSITFARRYKSISDLYALIEEYDNKQYHTGPIEYDYEYHYPRSVLSPRYRNKDFVINPPLIPEESSLVFDEDSFNTNKLKWAEGNNSCYAYEFRYWSMDYEWDGEWAGFEWAGVVNIKDGELSEVYPIDDITFPTPPSLEIKAWLLPVEEIFEKIKERADKYHTGGLYIDYNEMGNPARIRYLYLSPDSPLDNYLYSISIFINMED